MWVPPRGAFSLAPLPFVAEFGICDSIPPGTDRPETPQWAAGVAGRTCHRAWLSIVIQKASTSGRTPSRDKSQEDQGLALVLCSSFPCGQLGVNSQSSSIELQTEKDDYRDNRPLNSQLSTWKSWRLQDPVLLGSSRAAVHYDLTAGLTLHPKHRD